MDDDFAGHLCPPRKVPWVRLILPIAISCLLWTLIQPAVSKPREAARRSQCASNLRHIALALRAYHDHHGCFPPAYLADASGKPIHSWRTLILPFMDNQEIYDGYKFDELWDGPNNRKLADVNINLYRCPSRLDPKPGLTDYVLIRGPGTAFPGGDKRVTLADVRDKQSETILVAESADSGIHWSQPRDLDIDRMSFRINDPSRPGLSSRHNEAVNVIMVNGSYKCLRDGIRPKIVRALITIDGREPLDEGDLDP